ncbi:hypothetical protein F4802DRAFT_132080 [Xylaria palmicola]|nr:hypothetical protein F4802DRAFT_132080 [Xylaria palmicola]
MYRFLHGTLAISFSRLVYYTILYASIKHVNPDSLHVLDKQYVPGISPLRSPRRLGLGSPRPTPPARPCRGRRGRVRGGSAFRRRRRRGPRDVWLAGRGLPLLGPFSPGPSVHGPAPPPDLLRLGPGPLAKRRHRRRDAFFARVRDLRRRPVLHGAHAPLLRSGPRRVWVGGVPRGREMRAAPEGVGLLVRQPAPSLALDARVRRVPGLPPTGSACGPLATPRAARHLRGPQSRARRPRRAVIQGTVSDRHHLLAKGAAVVRAVRGAA